MKNQKRPSLSAMEFAPGLLSIQENPPRKLPRTVLYAVIVLFLIILLWMTFGQLDIIATAQGKLEPQSYVKIVQPAEGGIVEKIMVHEDQHVKAGQVLMQMDTSDANADTETIRTELELRSLQLRRIDAELNGHKLHRDASDPDDLFRQVQSQLKAHRDAYTESLGQARDALSKAKQDFGAAEQVLTKLEKITPILEQQAHAYDGMGDAGYAPEVKVREQDLAYLEKLQDLESQKETVKGMAAAVKEAGRHVASVTADYRSKLQNEWLDAERDYRKLKQEWLKQQNKDKRLELRAPQSGIVENLATHTEGTVVSPGTVLLSLVPDREPLVAAVRIKNQDIGFIYPHQKVRVKVAAYPFEKYGMIDGEVLKIGPDSDVTANSASPDKSQTKQNSTSSPLTYKALISLNAQHLSAQSKVFKLVPGMLVTAEINQGKRSVLEYILSPVETTLQDSGRER